MSMVHIFGSRPIIVFYCIALHLIWAGAIYLDHSSVGSTPVAALFNIVKDYDLLCGVLLGTSAMAFVGLFTRLPWTLVMLMPQQSLLLMSASGAATAIVLAQFADGVVRPRGFILTDQIHIILAALAHATAVITVGIRHE